MYTVSEDVVNESNVDTADIAYDHLKHIVPRTLIVETNFSRFGKPSSKPRPLLLSFSSVEEKHVFLKHAETLRQDGIRCDDYLTRQQQQERQVLIEDFSAFKANGHKPFFRGSELNDYHADKLRSCKQNQAQKVPTAKS